VSPAVFFKILRKKLVLTEEDVCLVLPKLPNYVFVLCIFCNVYAELSLEFSTIFSGSFQQHHCLSIVVFCVV